MRLPAPSSRLQLSRDLVLIGGGHAHALVLRRWGMRPLPGARLTLIDPAPVTAYTGMLPGYVAGHYRRDQLDIDLIQLCRHAGARILIDRAVDIDREAKSVRIEKGAPVPYDVLSIDVGIHGDVPTVPGLTEHGIAAKPLGPFADRWDRFLAEGGGPVAVIGGGIAGVELALAAAHRLHHAGHRVTLIERHTDILTEETPRTKKILKGRLSAYGVSCVTGAGVARITETAVEMKTGQKIDAHLTIAAAGAVPYSWLSGTGLTTTNGFVEVDPMLKSLSDPAIFAAGDCAHLVQSPRPKAGVFAVRQAPILANNLRAALMEQDGALRPYRPQKDYLKIVSMGRKEAVFTRGRFAIGGKWAWTLKDVIDQRFMVGLSDLPVMREDLPEETAQDAVADRSLCAGCGAKAGPAALLKALRALPAPARADSERGSGDDAGVLLFGDQRQVISTDTVRAFSHDPRLTARVATIHALGDIWAMGAKPQAGVMTLTLPRMTAALEERTIREVTETVAGALKAAGADLIGGHTGIGAELSIGLTVTGLTDQVIGQDGAREGDVLILTKPLGTGLVLAAAMKGEIPARPVAAAWETMGRSSGAAAEILAGHARAMTDVTGFGLANHLLGMLRASTLGARLDLSALPLLPGAADALGRGIRSSLSGGNASAAVPHLVGARPAMADILFDPQTSGGLLAAVPAERVDEVLSALAETLTPGTVIGEMTGSDLVLTLTE